MRNVIYIILLLFFCGCSEDKVENIYGTYGFKNEYIEQKLLIKPDGTFDQSIDIFKNNEHLKTNGIWWLNNFSGCTYISFKNYIFVLDYEGKLEDNYPKKGTYGIITGGFPVNRWFGETEISFLEGCYYKKIKKWEVGDSLN